MDTGVSFPPLDDARQDPSEMAELLRVCLWEKVDERVCVCVCVCVCVYICFYRPSLENIWQPGMVVCLHTGQSSGVFDRRVASIINYKPAVFWKQIPLSATTEESMQRCLGSVSRGRSHGGPFGRTDGADHQWEGQGMMREMGPCV